MDVTQLKQVQLKLGILVLILGINLRPIMASVSPLVGILENSLNVNHQLISLLTTVPVILMGLFALFTAKIQNFLNDIDVIGYGVLSIALASFLRIFTDNIFLLLFTSVLGGIGIALIQVQFPAYLKTLLSSNLSKYMGLFTTGIMMGAATAAGISAPLEHKWGWKTALSVMTIPACVALIVIPKLIIPVKKNSQKNYVPLPIRSLNAWYLMIFFGIGTGAYTLVLAWLPLHFIQLGWSKNDSGYLLSLLTMTEVIAGIIVSTSINKFIDSRQPLIISLLLILIGLVMLILYPTNLSIMIAITLGLGIGSLFPLSLIVSLDNAKNAQQASALLGLVQGGGYIIAAAFPFIGGCFIDKSHYLQPAWIFMLAGIVILLLMCLRFSPTKFSIHY
mgnify:CR=1 FL=1